MAKVKTRKKTGTLDDPAQTYIEGTEPDKIDEIDQAVQKLLSLKSKKQKMNEDLEYAKIDLVSVMESHGFECYATNGRLVTIEAGSTKIRIKKAKLVR